MKKTLVKIISAVKDFSDNMKKASTSAYAAQAALFVIISAFPLAMLLLTLIKYLPYFRNGNIEVDFSMLPKDVSDLFNSMLYEIIEGSTSTVLSISAVTALWSASKGVYSIMQGLTAVYSVKETRGYVRMRLLSMLYTLIFMVMVIAALGFLVFGNTIYHTLIGILPVAAENLEIISNGLKWLVGFGILVFFFELLYIFMPNRKTTVFKELPGALVSSVGWIGFSYIYAFYIDNFGNYGKIYGSLTAVVLLMLWMYFCMYIMLVGAEVNLAWDATYKMLASKMYSRTKKKIIDKKEQLVEKREELIEKHEKTK